MTFGVTCPVCGTTVDDDKVDLFLAGTAKGFHIVLMCCGQPIDEDYVARCMLRSPRRDVRIRAAMRKIFAAADLERKTPRPPAS